MKKKKKKTENTPRPLWVGYYERKTKSKKEKERSLEKKYKKDLTLE